MGRGTLTVVGAGLMGSGIAQVAAQAGYDVVLRDLGDDELHRARDNIASSYRRFVAKGQLSDADMTAALDRITTTTELEAAAEADIWV